MFWLNIWRTYRWKLSKNIRKAYGLFNHLYQNINGEMLAVQERKRLDLQQPEFTYGEVDFYTFAALLQKTNPQAHETFYDLGAGTGKAVMIAALLFPFNCCIGVEILPALQQAAEQVLQRLAKLSVLNQQDEIVLQKIKYVRGNLFDSDLSQADVVFVNATGFFAVSLQQLIEKLNTLKSGARIIISSKKLPEQGYSLIYNGVCQMSWAPCMVYIYQKT